MADWLIAIGTIGLAIVAVGRPTGHDNYPENGSLRLQKKHFGDDVPRISITWLGPTLPNRSSLGRVKWPANTSFSLVKRTFPTGSLGGRSKLRVILRSCMTKMMFTRGNTLAILGVLDAHERT